MNHGRHWWSAIVVILVISLTGVAAADEMHPVARNMNSVKFVNFPAFPTCAPGAVQSGDPAKGPSIILAKGSAGCVVPWHWHTPTEQLMIVSGKARLEAKGGTATILRAGGFAVMPSHHVHRFACVTDCVLYIYSDTAFDIHYVDAAGNELAPEAALKAVKEKTIMPGK